MSNGLIRKIKIISLALFISNFCLEPVFAVIPMETDIIQSTSKGSGWFQKMIQNVQDKIQNINKSKMVVAIGDGVNKAKQYASLIKSCVHQGEETYTYTEKDMVTGQKTDKTEKCPDWCKYVSYKRIKGAVLNSKAYKEIKLAEQITDDAIQISRLNEQFEQNIKTIAEDAEDQKELLREKLAMADQVLKAYTEKQGNVPSVDFNSFDNIEDAGERQKAMNEAKSKFYEAMEAVQNADDIVRAFNDKLTIKNELFMVDVDKADKITRLSANHASQIANIIRKDKEAVEELNNLRRESEEEGGVKLFGDMTLDDISIGGMIKFAKSKFKKKPGSKEKATTSEKHQNMIEEETKSVIDVSNVANESIQSNNDADNNPKTNQNAGDSGEGENEAYVLGPLTNTIIEIDTVKQIIDTELHDMEVQLLDLLTEGADYQPQDEEGEDEDISTVVDICNYELKENQPENFGDKYRNWIDHARNEIAIAGDDEEDKGQPAASGATKAQTAPTKSDSTPEEEIDATAGMM